MSVNKRYYWMKFFETFFQDAKIKKLKRLAGGDTYIVILLKIMLQTIKTEGIYIYEGLEPSLAEELELKIDEDYKTIQIVLDYLYSTQQIEKLSNSEYLIHSVVVSIGTETASTQRSKIHREKKKMLQCNTSATKCNTELELELKKKTHIDDEEFDWKTHNENSIKKDIKKDKVERREQDLYNMGKEVEI